MNIHEFRQMIDDIADREPEYSDREVTVMIKPTNSGCVGGILSTKVTAVIDGFDLDSWQIIIRTEDRLVKYGS